MRTPQRTLATLALGLTGISALTGAQANNTAAQQAAAQPGEMVVTATKREARIYDVPMAISAFSAKNLELAGIGDLVDIGKFVPNLNVTEYSAGAHGVG